MSECPVTAVLSRWMRPRARPISTQRDEFYLPALAATQQLFNYRLRGVHYYVSNLRLGILTLAAYRSQRMCFSVGVGRQPESERTANRSNETQEHIS